MRTTRWAHLGCRCASGKGTISGNSSSGSRKRENGAGRQCMASGGRGWMRRVRERGLSAKEGVEEQKENVMEKRTKTIKG